MHEVRKRYVVGIDGSRASHAAAQWAAERAAEDGGCVELVHAYAVPAIPSVGGPIRSPAERKAELRRARNILLRAAQHLPAGVDRVISPEEGAADRVLLDRSADADLLVLGARAQLRHPHLRMIGSIAGRCLRRSCVPVVMVPDPTSRPDVAPKATGAALVGSSN